MADSSTSPSHTTHTVDAALNWQLLAAVWQRRFERFDNPGDAQT